MMPNNCAHIGFADQCWRMAVYKAAHALILAARQAPHADQDLAYSEARQKLCTGAEPS
jgi:hypothetical protein